MMLLFPTQEWNALPKNTILTHSTLAQLLTQLLM